MDDEKKTPKEIYYEENVRDKVREVLELCRKAEISFYGVFALHDAGDNSGGLVSTTGILADDAPMQMKVGLAVSTGEAPLAFVPGLGLLIQAPGEGDNPVKENGLGSKTIH